MTTVLDLVTRAMANLGAIGLEEAPSNAEAQSCFSALNNMVETWNTESLMIYSIEPSVFNFVAGTASYTIGPGGNFNTARPVKIERAFNRDVNGNDYEIAVTENFEEYAAIIIKPTQSSLVLALYDDGNFPLKNLTMWPVPNSTAYTLVLWLWQAITAFATLADTVILPPGYKRAIETNLAVEIGPKFGRAISPDLRQLAVESKAALERINFNPKTLQLDPMLVRKGNSQFSSYIMGLTGPWQ